MFVTCCAMADLADGTAAAATTADDAAAVAARQRRAAKQTEEVEVIVKLGANGSYGLGIGNEDGHCCINRLVRVQYDESCRGRLLIGDRICKVNENDMPMLFDEVLECIKLYPAQLHLTVMRDPTAAAVKGRITDRLWNHSSMAYWGVLWILPCLTFVIVIGTWLYSLDVDWDEAFEHFFSELAVAHAGSAAPQLRELRNKELAAKAAAKAAAAAAAGQHDEL